VYIHTHIEHVPFTWDPRENASNVEERGFDFAFAAAIFTGPPVERIAVGRFASVVFTVIYTDRVASDGTPERRSISARVSKHHERKACEQAYPEA